MSTPQLITQRRKDMVALERMLKENPPEPYKHALQRAYRDLLVEDAEAMAGIRRPSDWPFCPHCDTAYQPAITAVPYLRELRPACRCARSEPVFRNRPPEVAEWTYMKDELRAYYHTLERCL